MSAADPGRRSAGAGNELRARLFVGLQYVLPQHGLSRLVLRATRVRAVWFKNLLIRVFLKLFAVDLSEAAESEALSYVTFNEFFTRALKPGARTIAVGTTDISCPVDGAVSECGDLDGATLLQAKGRRYALTELLADQPWAPRFADGTFATIYLAPFNYHRIHMPLDGVLLDTVYVPGRLFSVNETTARRVPRLFARNERVLTLFAGEFGQFAVILVGALNVGSISTVWAGDIAPAARRVVTRVPAPKATLSKGAELGRFNMGSTVILLFEPRRAVWRATLRPGALVRVGESLGSMR